jgi:Tfp pilus assembly PilM family ATPase
MPSMAMGIDISSAFVRVVVLSLDKKGRYCLEYAAVEPLPFAYYFAPLGDRLGYVQSVIGTLIRNSGCSTQTVAMSLPQSLALTGKFGVLEGLRPSEYEQQIELEVESRISYPIEKAAWDYTILGPSFAQQGELDVQWFSVEKFRVDERLQLAKACGFDLKLLELDNHVRDLLLSRWLAQTEESFSNVTDALLELDKTSARLRGVRQGEWVFDRELSLTMNEWLTEPLEVTSKLWTQELQPVLDASSFRLPAYPLRRVLLMGDVSGVPSIQQWSSQLAATLGVDVIWLNPFTDVLPMDVTSHEACRSGFLAQQYMQACGLALRLLLT